MHPGPASGKACPLHSHQSVAARRPWRGPSKPQVDGGKEKRCHEDKIWSLDSSSVLNTETVEVLEVPAWFLIQTRWKSGNGLNGLKVPEFKLIIDPGTKRKTNQQKPSWKDSRGSFPEPQLKLNVKSNATMWLSYYSHLLVLISCCHSGNSNQFPPAERSLKLVPSRSTQLRAEPGPAKRIRSSITSASFQKWLPWLWQTSSELIVKDLSSNIYYINKHINYYLGITCAASL